MKKFSVLVLGVLLRFLSILNWPFLYVSHIISNALEVIFIRKYLLELELCKRKKIYISTFMKSGTTWMQMILYQMTTKGEMDFNHINDVIPSLDRDIRFKKKIDRSPSPVARIYKTHMDYRLFPGKMTGKFICVIMDGMDVSVSQYHHWNDTGKPVTFEDSFNNYFINDWFHYMKHWVPNKKNYDILYVKYEDLQNRLEETILEIAKFCDIEVNPEDIPRIMERSSFAFMKQHEDKFGLLLPKVNTKNFIRKGTVNQAVDYYNSDLFDKYKQQFSKHLSEFELLKDYNPANKQINN